MIAIGEGRGGAAQLYLERSLQTPATPTTNTIGTAYTTSDELDDT